MNPLNGVNNVINALPVVQGVVQIPNIIHVPLHQNLPLAQHNGPMIVQYNAAQEQPSQYQALNIQNTIRSNKRLASNELYQDCKKMRSEKYPLAYSRFDCPEPSQIITIDYCRRQTPYLGDNMYYKSWKTHDTFCEDNENNKRIVTDVDIKYSYSNTVSDKEKTYDILLPPYWALMKDNKHNVNLVPLQENEVDYFYVSGLFMNSTTDLVLRGIDRIQNPRLYSWYEKKKMAIAKKNNGVINECYYYNRFNPIDVTDIIINGLDYREDYATGILGKCLHFCKRYSVTPDIKMQYSKEGAPHLYVILYKVITGLSVSTTKELVRPPLVYGKKIISDSTTCGSKFLVGIYDNYQCYPAYLIKYEVMKKDCNMH